MTDPELLAAFTACTLPIEQWTHRAHVRMAYLLASQSPLPDAIAAARQRIQAYNAAVGTPAALDRGYHETITQAFMRLTAAAIARTGPHRDSEDFCIAHPELLDKRVLRQFYTSPRVMTFDAKRSFVEPDLRPLPVVLDAVTAVHCAVDGDMLDAVRELFREYAGSLAFDLGFQNFDAELASLPGKYALPQGRLMLALVHDEPAACIALRPLGDAVCELKRLWVRPAHRGRSLGRVLTTLMISEAQRIGYRILRLDTIDTMQPAIRLYRSLGFVDTAPYTENPIPGAVFLELPL